jgi:tRNA G18 (ribose-2'-O)-methylase SpoU
MHKPLTKTKIKKLNKSSADEINPELNIVLLLQDLEDPVNVGAFFRIADAAGVSRLVLTGNTPTPPNPKVSMVSRGFERRIPWSKVADTKQAIEDLRQEGFEIIAAELTESSVNYSKYKYSSRICLVMGNEPKGVYKNVLELCDAAVHIPMLGKGPSLNVHTAGAVIVYEIISQHMN